MNWNVEFHVHKNASLLDVGTLLAKNIIGKNDQLVVYASRLLNNVEHNYNTIEKEALIVVLHYLLGNKFLFYVDHMALIYLVKKSWLLRRITKWLLLLMEYDFTVIYKLGKTHEVVDVLYILPNG
jgi:hypothetical protein